MSTYRATPVYAQRGLAVRIAYLLVAGLHWLSRRLTRPPAGVVVLCYHCVRREHLPAFAWQMRRLAQRAVSLDAIGRAAAALPAGPAVCVTFDDGYRCVLKYALPAMQAIGVPATIFAVSGNLGEHLRWDVPPGHPDSTEPLASAAELAAAAAAGLCRIGSHTVSHPRLPTLSPPAAFRELAESRATLSALLGAEVTDLAFPYGAYDGETVAQALAAGYRRLFTLDPQLGNGRHEPRVIGRFLISPDVWRLEFILTSAGSYTWLAGWRTFWRRLRDTARPRAPRPQTPREAPVPS